MSLSPDERRFALAACLCAPAVELSLRTAGLRHTLRWVEALSSDSEARHRLEPQRHALEPQRAAAIIDSVYRIQPLTGQCLPRALLQYFLHRRRGDGVRFVVGVKRPEAQGLNAHAWVEKTAGPARSVDFEAILVHPSRGVA